MGGGCAHTSATFTPYRDVVLAIEGDVDGGAGSPCCADDAVTDENGYYEFSVKPDMGAMNSHVFTITIETGLPGNLTPVCDFDGGADEVAVITLSPAPHPIDEPTEQEEVNFGY
jgi:hypothetical protein